MIGDLLHWIVRRRCERGGRIIAQLLVLGVVARLLELHLEVVQKAVVGRTLRRGAAEGESTGGDVVLDEFAVVGRLAGELHCAVFEDVLEHGC